ncbi:MAG TPA: methylated-DNA--[protein]-cysteine S-methyltransferase [Amycolatopsis sp.]|nr:methylated-DNA--[protein]-cysteine S-methyltransferase [Amycolatopsis sp.]
MITETAAAGTSSQDAVLDVFYRTVDSPVGALLLAATYQGLVRVAFDREEHDAVLAALARDVGPRIRRAPALLDTAAGQLDEYFSGVRRAFELPWNLRLAKGFRRAVLTHLPAIGYGRTESYAQVALAAGSAKAVRAAGTACAANPLPIVLPCHRVIHSDGTPGAYAGGETAKKTLLALESAGA